MCGIDGGALAVWDEWFPIAHMQAASGCAKHTLAAAHSLWWAVVCGPTTAMLASAKRLNWQCLSATSFETDVGRTLDQVIQTMPNLPEMLLVLIKSPASHAAGRLVLEKV